MEHNLGTLKVVRSGSTAQLIDRTSPRLDLTFAEISPGDARSPSCSVCKAKILGTGETVVPRICIPTNSIRNTRCTYVSRAYSRES